MKYVKMLGLAAVAAMALMAFLGASSASATVLCKTNTDPCGAGWIYSGPLVTSLQNGTSVLKSTGGSLEDTCTTSEVTGSVSESEASGTVTGLTFTGCSKPTSVVNQDGTLTLEGNTLKATGFEVTVEAVSGVSCVYSANTGTTLGTFTGGNPATTTINAVVNKKSGSFLCPSDSKWEGTYVVTTPASTTLHSASK
jgi:hypothetical protein